MAIGIISAIPEELRQLRALLARETSEERNGATFERGRIEGREVVLVEAGIGKVNTAMKTTLLVDRFGCDPVVFMGVAGGLDPELHIGDVVVADRTIQHDAGVIEEERLAVYQAGHVPFFNPTDRLGWKVPDALLDRVRARLRGFALPHLPAAAGGQGRRPRIVFGTILSGDQYIHCERTRERLFRELAGRAVEMEGGALAQVCEAFGVGWLDIRALSDLAGRNSRFDFAAFVHAAADYATRILLRLLPVLEPSHNRARQGGGRTS